MSKRKYIVISEGILSSILKDFFTFGSIGLLLWFNHTVLDGNIWLDVLFVVLAIMMAATRGSKDVHRFNSKQDAVNYLKGEGYDQ